MGISSRASAASRLRKVLIANCAPVPLTMTLIVHCARLTFELSGPLRWTAGPARGSITERTAQALTAAVAGPLERRVRLAREIVGELR